MHVQKLGHFILLLFFIAVNPLEAQVLFEDTSDSAGPFHKGESWGASWGDFNGDNCPDIAANNHRQKNSLWRNDCQGKFEDVMLTFDADRVYVGDPIQDTHGMSFVDFDNDGDQDIFSARSNDFGRGQLFVNDGLFGDEQGISYGLDIFTSGRQGAFFDYDNDGLLDLFGARSGNNSGSTYVFKNNGVGNIFQRVDSSLGILSQCRKNNYTQFSNFYTASPGMDMVCGREGTFPERLYNMSTVPFQNVSSILTTISSNVNDTVWADFDNDLDVDLLALKSGLRPSGASRVSPSKIESWITTDNAQGVKGFSFSLDGDLTVSTADISLVNNATRLSKIFIGSSGYNPTTYPFTLDPANTANQGISSGTEFGYYIGYDLATQEWTVFLKPDGNQVGYIAVEGANISEPAMINLHVRDLPLTPRYHRNDGSTFTADYSTGLGVPLNCGSIGHGDFDNDMDIDIYFVCRQGVENTVNRIFWNNGDGTFTEGSGHGAEGPLGAGLDSGVGTAESVAVADYDVDGFLDFFVTNGNLLEPQDESGWDTLIRNTGNNSNHWIELDLVGNGTTTNRDGVGATVRASVPGLTQMREQHGGYHRWSQDHQRIHFGLGSNTTVDITVDWPDGSQDIYEDVAADKLYKVNQGGSIDEAVVGPVALFPAPQPGDECGSQTFNTNVDKGIFLSKDCTSGEWTLRAISGGSPTDINYTGSIVSDMSISNLIFFSLEGDDFVAQPTSSEIDFSLSMKGSGVDGFSFSLDSGASSCFTLDAPADARIYIGAGYIPASSPLNMKTLQPCFNIDVLDVSVSEGAGSVAVEVSLSSMASEQVTVDYQTVNATATSGLDYSSVSGTLTFIAGDISETINIPILQDNNIEDVETFTIELSNAVNGLLTDGVGVVSINDDETNACGAPTIDRTIERELFLWKDCAGDGSWHVRATAGGGSALTYLGNLTTFSNFSNVEPFSIESSDVLDSNIPGLIDFKMTMSGPYQDGFDFEVGAGSTCLTLDTPPGQSVLVGENKVAVSSPFDIQTLGLCGSVSSIGISDASVSEGAGSVAVEVTLSSMASEQVTVDYATADGTATSGLDYSSVSGTLTFVAGDTSKTISIPILQDSAIEDIETFTVQLSNAVNGLITDDTGTVSINDDETNACGAPAIDRTIERELFLWQDCAGDGNWYVRATSGGGSALTYVGNLMAFSNFSNVEPFSIESSDVLDSSTPGVIDFEMTMSGPYQDGFNFEVGAGSTCLTLDTPIGQSVLVGENKVSVSSPFDIKTLSVCSAIPGNMAPVLTNPGDQTDSIGANVSLNINAMDADGDTLVFSASGLPSGLSIDSASGEISGTVNTAGVSNVTVSVTDGLQSDNVNLTWTVEAIPNQAPVSDAGSDQTITLPASANLAGSASDDGLPNPPSTLTAQWSQVSGPGTVVFGDASSLTTTADFSVAGTYELRLTADDSDLTGSDEVIITVEPAVVACIEADFESGTQGWSTLSSSSCTTGTFIRGTPNEIVTGGLTTQVGGDHTPGLNGTGSALYTQFNISNGVDDVDNGECAVQSPDYLTGEESELSLWYFHGQRDTGDDPIGDFFKIEYQVNNGTWTDLVNIGDVQTNAVWSEVTATIPAGSNVRLRARISDGIGSGDLNEAGIDDLQICPL